MKGDATTPAPEPRWTAEPPEYDNRQGWWLHDDQRWDDAFVASGLTEPQARYAATLLNAGGLGDDTDLTLAELEEQIWEAVTVTACSRCGRTVFNAELDSSIRCKECAS